MSSGTDYNRATDETTGDSVYSTDPGQPTTATEEPKKELTEEELVTQAYREFEINFLNLRNTAAFMDRNSLNRVLMAIIGFPIANEAINLVKRSNEKQFLLMALNLRKPLAFLNDYITKKHGNLQDQAVDNIVDKVVEANPEFKRPNVEESTEIEGEIVNG
jgi:hypothetical protein